MTFEWNETSKRIYKYHSAKEKKHFQIEAQSENDYFLAP